MRHDAHMVNTKYEYGPVGLVYSTGMQVVQESNALRATEHPPRVSKAGFRTREA